VFAKDRGKSLTTAGGAHGYVEVVLRGGGFAKGLVPCQYLRGANLRHRQDEFRSRAQTKTGTHSWSWVPMRSQKAPMGKYDPPTKIIAKLRALEGEIAKDLDELEAML